MEMRPLCGVAVPVSDTSTLPWFESAIPIGRLSPEVTVVPGHNCALASTTMSIGESAIITATFAPTLHLPMRASLLDWMWELIRLLCFSPSSASTVFYDCRPGSGLRFAGYLRGAGSIEANEGQLNPRFNSGVP
jgi:hypothetical protein